MPKSITNVKEKTVKKTAVKAPSKTDGNRVIASVKSIAGRNAKKRNSKVDTGKLELLITIVNRKKAEFYEDLLQGFEVNMQLSLRARGTAQAQTLALLGLEDSPKTAIFSFIREDRLQDALATLKEKFKSIKDGGGVAYTVPLTSVIGVAIFGFLSNNDKTVKEDKQ